MSENRLFRVLVAALATALVSMSALPVHAQPRERSKEDPEHKLADAMKRGDYPLARKLSVRHDDVPFLLARATLATYVGRLADAERFSRVALERAAAPADKSAAGAALGRALFARGAIREAEAALRAGLEADPLAHAVRLELGRVLRAQGKAAEAQTVLDVFSMLYNDGLIKTPGELTMLGQAMELIESFDDANYAFGQAIRQDKEYADAYAAWGLLLLAKYNIPDAKRSFEDALRSNPAHPDALVGMATVEMLTSNQSDKVRVYLGRAAEVAPGLAGVSMVRAHLAMGDEDCLRAREAADEVLSRQPKHLEALSIHVTCDYLADDLKAYAESRDAVLALNPKYADLLAMTAEYAIRSHRYVEAMDVYRHALRIDPEHGRSLLGLGVGLSRIGKEDEAVTYLERANEVDPYNVRAYNMAELYENVLNRYGFTEFDGFKLRSSPEQAEMIDLIVAPVVSEAMGVFSAKYAFTPHEYLAVEVYPDPATFSVRSVGLPNISPHGICFGRVVTVRSPSDGNFNWKQVLWHELAHVYHIQLSNSRVPRWFTEGLAEYETNVYDPSWVRHHDQEIAVKLFKGEVPSVLELNRGFTHAKSYDEVLRSYHLSSLAIHYIAQKWTFERIPDMLRAWGESKGTPEVFEGVLGVTTSEFDDGFARWLELRHMTFQQQLMVDLEEVRSPKELERARRLNERDPKLWAETALSHMVRGEPDEMEDALHVALQKAPDDAWVNHVAAMIRAKQGRPKDTLVHGGKVLAALEDSYELRVLLGRASLVTDDLEGARVHFEAASQLYPDGIEAWSLLGRLGRNTKDEELYQRSLARIYELNQHDAGVARLRAKRLQDDGVWELLGEVAERWYDINPFDPSVHRARAKSFLELGDGDGARAAFEAYVLLLDADEKRALLESIGALASYGFTEQARAFSERALEAGADASEIKRAMAQKRGKE